MEIWEVSCGIEEEFSNFTINRDSRVLLIGVGAFPMTPLLIAKNTQAKIEVNTESYLDLSFTKEATHIIIASTIPEKLDILQDMYSLTNEKAVVSMGYGNGFKSLFNYPLTEIQNETWKNAENIHFDNNVFDVAMYIK